MVISKIFFDTNVVLDIIDSTRLGHDNAIKLWKKLLMKDYLIFISEDMLSTIFYINKIDKISTLEFFQLILKRWQIVPFGKGVIENAINLSLEKNLDLEDTLQCLCAKENGCEVLITNDKKFYDCGISIYTTEKFLKEKNVQK
jgi:predicted nucleic acid-binding protein